MPSPVNVSASAAVHANLVMGKVSPKVTDRKYRTQMCTYCLSGHATRCRHYATASRKILIVNYVYNYRITRTQQTPYTPETLNRGTTVTDKVDSFKRRVGQQAEWTGAAQLWLCRPPLSIGYVYVWRGQTRLHKCWSSIEMQ